MTDTTESTAEPVVESAGAAAELDPDPGSDPEITIEPPKPTPPPKPPAKRETKPKDEPKKSGPGELCVAPGKSVTSRRGILGPGTIVTPSVFHGGEESVRALLKSGALVR